MIPKSGNRFSDKIMRKQMARWKNAFEEGIMRGKMGGSHARPTDLRFA